MLILLSAFFATVKRPLVVVGGLQGHEQAAAVELLLKLNVPYYAEAQSGLREHEALRELRLENLETFQQAELFRTEFDGLIRIGGVPTARLWRDLEDVLFSQKKNLH